ncbi:hypothetical protein HIM_07807 [Hirsutella minnesotensis 3608]|uniref:Uncharacterized protein n=1 Tax=Hirsutella minnesotensis 3608 TaxID=1043627 RepID=A0A0F7ZTC3_9HYPO|nr:hypothetical protein HIM_07807 [Hirsutella minnesotensis 3608]
MELAVAYTDPPEYMKKEVYEAFVLAYIQALAAGASSESALSAAIEAAVDRTWAAGMGISFGRD